MSYRLLLVFLMVLLARFAAQAEYRVFVLRIAKKSNAQDYRLVQSTLDPLQYVGLHHVGTDEIVTYDDTWMCKGRTGDHRPLCPNPRAPASEEGPENKP